MYICMVSCGDMYLLLKLKNKICTYFYSKKKNCTHFNYFEELYPLLIFHIKGSGERDTWFDINKTFGVLFKISEIRIITWIKLF
jgi:hypothetical protein